MCIKSKIKRLFALDNPGWKKRVKKLSQTVFGIGDKPDPKRYLKSPDLDHVEVAMALVRIETEVAWIKRILWVAVIGGGLSKIFG